MEGSVCCVGIVITLILLNFKAGFTCNVNDLLSSIGEVICPSQGPGDRGRSALLKNALSNRSRLLNVYYAKALNGNFPRKFLGKLPLMAFLLLTSLRRPGTHSLYY